MWPMNMDDATVCPSFEGGSSGSKDVLGKPVPEGTKENDAEKPEEKFVLLEGDLPPDHYLTHRPKMARCETCQQAKMYHRQCRRTLGETRAVRHQAKKFGEVITMDHVSSDGELGQSLSGNTTALIVRDVATGWLDAYPAGSKCAEEVVASLQHFVSHAEVVGYVATDDAPEYKAACRTLGYRHKTSTPGRPQTNGLAERSVQEAIQGARSLLHQCGAPTRWWSKAIRHFCFLHNVTRKVPGEPAPWELRFGTAFTGPLLAFGSEVTYKSAVDNPNDGMKFGPSSRQGVLVGYFMNPGGAWSKDFLVYDLDTIRQNKDCRRLRTRRCGEVFQPKGLPVFPIKNVEALGDLVPLPPPAKQPEILEDDTALPDLWNNDLSDHSTPSSSSSPKEAQPADAGAPSKEREPMIIQPRTRLRQQSPRSRSMLRGSG